jgi:hypothetical protein
VLRIEFYFVMLVAVLAFVFPEAGTSMFARVETAFASFARRQVLAVALVGLVALTLRVALLPILPIPEPAVSDEFSYLLAADTFAHGRMTNPTHPMWVHFETLQVIDEPTYASKYPPAQGLVLAAGQVIGGSAFWGVWLSVGLMCASICWALQGWLAPSWALLGGLFAVLHLGVFSYWANSYWGGAVAAIGGALVFGALPRIQKTQRITDALLMGLGLAILANSRPYEGLLFSLPVAAALLLWMRSGKRPPLSILARKVVLPIVTVLVLAAGAMGYYFWRVTGSPFRMPYQVFDATYDPTPVFLWQSPGPLPNYRHLAMQTWEQGSVAQFVSQHTLGGLLVYSGAKIVQLWLFFLGPLFTLLFVWSLFVLPRDFSWRDIRSQTRFLLVAAGVYLAGTLLGAYFFPHYAAPAVGMIFAWVMISMQNLRRWTFRGRPVGRFVVRAAPVLLLLLFVVRAFAKPLNLQVGGPWMPWSPRTLGFLGRSSVLRELDQTGSGQLVLVKYTSTHGRDDTSRDKHPRVDEWVYNGADIDGAHVVWARDMGAAKNAELLQYYKNRTVWLLEADEVPPKLSPYANDQPGSEVATVVP